MQVWRQYNVAVAYHVCHIVPIAEHNWTSFYTCYKNVICMKQTISAGRNIFYLKVQESVSVQFSKLAQKTKEPLNCISA
jgi:hypothetical protein